ncbi:MAG TPA: hypothetical protein VL282_17165 [Tepidisphaeraceae bacterium]|jgi:hypothetical protein|nr:hypothetical protein [Tepidisphaeraceae bacterium]
MNRLILLALVGVLFAGCKSEPKPTVSEQEVYNNAKMSSLPTAVKTAFNREHPGAAVLSSQIIHTATGPAAYEITYRAATVEQTQQAWYREDGSRTEPAQHR